MTASPLVCPIPTRRTSPYAPLSVNDLAALPPTEWAVEGLLPERGRGMLFGVSGAGKSLAALDLTLSIAAGVEDWFGRRVKQGRVIYIVGEGLHGLDRRIRAWRSIHPGADLERFHILPAMPPLNDSGAVDEMLEELAGAAIRSASWIVWDTLARAIPGVDENSATDLGMAIASVDRIATELSAGALLVHHAGHNTSRERGSTALRASCDFVLGLSEDDGRHQLKVSKMRDGDHGDPVFLRMVKQPPSVVFQSADPPVPLLTPAQRDLLKALAKEGPMNHTALVESSPKSRSTASDLVRTLLGVGLIEKSGTLYRITATGSEAIA